MYHPFQQTDEPGSCRQLTGVKGNSRMGRQKDPVRRAELLDAVTGYVLQHGLADLSLRPLAGAVGTSPRILLYHFGSKEQLVASALAEARAREAATVASYRASAADVPLGDLLQTAWRWMSARP